MTIVPLLLPAALSLGACSGLGASDDQFRFTTCDIETVAELDATDTSYTGFSAADVVSLIDGLSGALTWTYPIDGYDSTDRLTLHFENDDSSVLATTRSIVDGKGGNCAGIEGDALQFSARAAYNNTDDSLLISGTVTILANSVSDRSGVVVMEAWTMADAIPSDMAADLAAIDAESTATGWGLSLYLSPGTAYEPYTMDTPSVVVEGLGDSGHAAWFMGDATLAPD